ncbi:poly polymerase [Apiospora aurea]|uniref:Putative gamma-glutamylcyclotransferase n=1 Tax=Apiospora aurea TaxID=335848 RepID=A0ABR1QTA0_9PEZI
MDDSQKGPPTPPPLPPAPRWRRMNERPSQYLANLEAAGEETIQEILRAPHSLPPPPQYEPIHYFFYGTLKNPRVLVDVLGTGQAPLLRPAKIIDYTLANWGDYKGLIDGSPGEEVLGLACEITSAEHEHKIAYYETNAYCLAPCLIDFADCKEPKQVSGNTFMYAGDAAALQEGRFDRKLWECQIGTDCRRTGIRRARGLLLWETTSND